MLCNDTIRGYFLELSNLHLSPGNIPKVEPSSPNSRGKSKPIEALDDYERKVLTATTRINGISYVPFLDFDLNERFAYPVPFGYPIVSSEFKF